MSPTWHRALLRTRIAAKARPLVPQSMIVMVLQGEVRRSLKKPCHVRDPASTHTRGERGAYQGCVRSGPTAAMEPATSTNKLSSVCAFYPCLHLVDRSWTASQPLQEGPLPASHLPPRAWVGGSAMTWAHLSSSASQQDQTV